MDRELLLPLGFLFLAPLGFAYGALAGYHYFRFERPSDTPRVPVAIAALAIQYALIVALNLAQHSVLLPTILMFLVLMTSITTIRLGLQARSGAGTRIALAGLFTLGAYLCKMGGDYYEFFVKFRLPG